MHASCACINLIVVSQGLSGQDFKAEMLRQCQHCTAHTLNPASLCAMSLVEAVHTIANELPRGSTANSSPDESHYNSSMSQQKAA